MSQACCQPWERCIPELPLCIPPSPDKALEFIKSILPLIVVGSGITLLLLYHPR